MKKTLLAMSLVAGMLLFAQPEAHAQQEQPLFKKHLIGGSVSFGTSKTDNPGMEPKTNKTTGITFTPTYVYYLNSLIGLGVNLNYNYSKQKNPTEDILERKSSTYSFGPFVRFTIPLWQSRFSIYNDLGIYGIYDKSVGEYATFGKSDVRSWGLGAYYEPGLMFRLKSNISLQASLGQLIGYEYFKNGPYTTSHNFGIRANHGGTNDFKIGVNFLF